MVKGIQRQIAGSRPISAKPSRWSAESGSNLVRRPSSTTGWTQPGPAGSALGEAADADRSFELVGHLGKLARKGGQLPIQVVKQGPGAIDDTRIGTVGRGEGEQVRTGERVVARLEHLAQAIEETVHVGLDELGLIGPEDALHGRGREVERTVAVAVDLLPGALLGLACRGGSIGPDLGAPSAIRLVALGLGGDALLGAAYAEGNCLDGDGP